jgi:hypothetical protein
MVSMAVVTDKNNSYDIPENLCFSLPVEMTGNW